MANIVFRGFNSLKDDQELFRSDQPRRVILVFHDLSNELEKLHEIGFDCTENEVIGAADTQRLNGTGNGSPQQEDNKDR